MKVFLFFAPFLLILIGVLRANDAAFEIAKTPVVGVSNALQLNTGERAVIILKNDDRLLIELIEAQYHKGDEIVRETCSVVWTKIANDHIRGGTAKGMVLHASSKRSGEGYNVKRVDGSNELTMGEYTIRWSYGASDRIFLYPQAGLKFAKVSVASVSSPGSQ